MSFTIINNIDIIQCNKWKEESKIKLKEKILRNIQDRLRALETIINNTVKSIICDIQSKNIVKSIDKIISGHTYITPQFQVTVTKQLYESIEKWKGVNIKTMHVLPDTFEKYYKIAQNYWSRNTAKWLGDHLFHPLLTLIFNQLIPNIVEKIYQKYSGRKQKIQDEVRIAEEFLKFSVLKEILHAKIRFDKTKNQPIILDHAFAKSKLFKQLIKDIGNETNVKFQIPANTQVQCYLYPSIDLY